MRLHSIVITTLLVIVSTCVAVGGAPIPKDKKQSAKSNKATPQQKAVQAEKKSLYDLEVAFRENALKVESILEGKTITVETHVITVDKVDGKPRIFADTVFDGGIEVCSDIFLNPSSVKAALDLKNGDRIEVTGKFISREIRTKDVVEGQGYTGTYGGSSYTTTKTLSWAQYRFDNATIKVIETEAARVKRVEEEEAKTKVIVEIWKEAISRLDKEKAKKAFELGLDSSYVNSAVLELVRLDPKLEIYDQCVDFFKFMISSGKADVGNAIAWTLGESVSLWEGHGRKSPKLFKTLVDADLVKLDYVLPNGDNLLLYLIKDSTLNLDKSKPTDRLKIGFDESDVELVRILAQNPKCKGMADFKDKFGKTARDYMPEKDNFLYSDERSKAIRDLILGMK